MKLRGWLSLGWALLAVVSCNNKKSAQEASTPQSLAVRGKSVYVANCTACHNVNPAQDGGLGPAVTGASLALLERRIVHGDYPADYKPKRQSRLMVALPHLKDDVAALHAYLNSSDPK